MIDLPGITIVDLRDGARTPRPALAQLRADVEARRQDVNDWERELAQHPTWLRRATARYDRHIGELKRVLGLPDDAGELAVLAMVTHTRDREAGMRAQHVTNTFKAELAADRTLDRAFVAHRSGVLPKELALARHMLAQAQQALDAAEERRRRLLEEVGP
jgi:hypothetical protein